MLFSCWNRAKVFQTKWHTCFPVQPATRSKRRFIHVYSIKLGLPVATEGAELWKHSHRAQIIKHLFVWCIGELFDFEVALSLQWSNQNPKLLLFFGAKTTVVTFSVVAGLETLCFSTSRDCHFPTAIGKIQPDTNENEWDCVSREANTVFSHWCLSQMSI